MCISSLVFARVRLLETQRNYMASLAPSKNNNGAIQIFICDFTLFLSSINNAVVNQAKAALTEFSRLRRWDK